MSRKSILSKLNALMEPAPSSADPEDFGEWDGTSSARAPLDGDDDSSNTGDLAKERGDSSALRGDAAMADEEWGGRYSSRKVSRTAVKEDENEEDDSSDGDEDGEMEAEAEENYIGQSEDDDEEEGGGDDDAAEEEDEIGSGDDDEGGEDDEDSDLDDDDDDGGREILFKGVARKVDSAQNQLEASSSVDEQLAELDRQDRQGSLAAGSGQATMGQVARAEKARALLRSHEALLEARILQQQLLGVANRLPLATARHKLSGGSDDGGGDGDDDDGGDDGRNGLAGAATAPGLAQASARLQSVLVRLCTLREDLRMAHGAAVGQDEGAGGAAVAESRSTCVLDNGARATLTDPEEEEEEEDVANNKNGGCENDLLLGAGNSDSEEDSEEKEDGDLKGEKEQQTRGGGVPEGRKRKLESVWADVDAGFQRGRPFWESTLELWQQRAAVGGLARKKFKVVNRGPFEQASAALARGDRRRSLRRAHPKRGDVRVIGDGEGGGGGADQAGGASKAVEDAGNGEDKEEEEEEEKDEEGAKEEAELRAELDLRLFDDKEFYHQQLKEFLDSRSSVGGAGAGGALASMDDAAERSAVALEAARKHRSNRGKKRGVDNKASKGRKIRYDLLPKLENFMFPKPRAAPPLNARDLFSSLFGGNYSTH